MKWTNKYNIDPAIAAAVIGGEERGDVGDASVTQLIRPPQMAYLERLHWDEIEQDVSDGLYRLTGQIVHQIVQAVDEEGAVKERRLALDVGGWKVTGQIDLWRPSKELVDYKETSVWSFILGEKVEWEEQVNYYRLFCEHHDLPVERAKIAAILRDWKRSQYQREGEDGDYPPIPFLNHPIYLWPINDAMSRLRQRVAEHQAAAKGDYRPCTEDERWAKPTTWAVKKKGGRYALRGGAGFLDPASAQDFARRQRFPTEIEKRPGQNTRCEGYCRAAVWCKQAKALGVEAVA